MYNEFIDVPLGMKVLESYEIQDTNINNDMVVLFFYGLVSCCRFAVFYTQLIPHLNNCFYRVLQIRIGRLSNWLVCW